MEPTRNDTTFAGSIPELYDLQMVPLIFEPYAIDLADRVAGRAPIRVLEIAAGTGVVTRRMATTLPAASSIVATDLNPAMLARAKAVGTARPVQWQPADAMRLPFADASFDAVVCQFGAMFFPDKGHAFAETRRVLAPGGAFLFNVWDRIADNEFADVADRAVAALLDVPTTFMARVPHGYHDLATVADDLRRGGFVAAPATTTVAARSRAASAHAVAVAYCQGTPMRNEIEARDPALLETAVARTAEALAARFGSGPVDGKIQAHVIVVDR
jgi:SAM-dependent methyltransferase